MNPRLKLILETLAGRWGREQAISGPNMELITGIPERTIRRILKQAWEDGILGELQFPAVGKAGLGFYIADDVEDFQEAYDTMLRTRRAIDRGIAAFRRGAECLGIRLNKTAP